MNLYRSSQFLFTKIWSINDSVVSVIRVSEKKKIENISKNNIYICTRVNLLEINVEVSQKYAFFLFTINHFLNILNTTLKSSTFSNTRWPIKHTNNQIISSLRYLNKMTSANNTFKSSLTLNSSWLCTGIQRPTPPPFLSFRSDPVNHFFKIKNNIRITFFI